MSSISGKILVDAFELVKRCGGELNNLIETFSMMLVESLNDKENSLPCVVAGEWEEDTREDDSRWVYTDSAYTIPLKSSKLKKKPDLYLSFQISMTGNGINISGYKEPLLHINFWSSRCTFSGSYVGVPLPDEIKDIDIIKERLIIWGNWKDKKWNERQWTFSLRLAELNSADDLKLNIVEPVLALLKGEDVRKALPDDLYSRALVRYPAKEKLVETGDE